MSGKIVAVKYECTHPSCQVFCKKGEILLEEAGYSVLTAAANRPGTMRSPKDLCKLGYDQAFKVISVAEATEEDINAVTAPIDAAKDPFSILSAEHQHVLKHLEMIEHQVRIRDIDALWRTTAMVENDIILHSIKKEEEGLFPVALAKIPMGEAFLGIMKEDHREFISILHAFRYGLQNGDILDGFVNSLVMNLRNHIRKEDEEMFPLMRQNMETKDIEAALALMTKLESEHTSFDPGDRLKKPLNALSADHDKIEAQIAALKTITHKGGEECCH